MGVSPGPETKSAALRYALVGLVMGVGAPLGALALRVFVGGEPIADLREHFFFYSYSLVGTCAAFVLLGVVVGSSVDRLRRSRDQYRTLSDRDELTGLLNARAFRRHYQRTLEQARRDATPLSLLLLDVDGLKAINDEWGHAAGSRALVRVARALERTKRVGDLAARWGGDEFGVVMPGADVSAARRLAQSISDALTEKNGGEAATEPAVSVTIGIAALTPAGGDLFELADRALYEGKHRGRGQLRVAG